MSQPNENSDSENINVGKDGVETRRRQTGDYSWAIPNYKLSTVPPCTFSLCSHKAYPGSLPSNCFMWLNRDYSVQTANDLDPNGLIVNRLCRACQTTCFGICGSTPHPGSPSLFLQPRDHSKAERPGSYGHTRQFPRARGGGSVQFLQAVIFKAHCPYL